MAALGSTRKTVAIPAWLAMRDAREPSPAPASSREAASGRILPAITRSTADR